jgi:hypothetical protein
MSDSASFGWQSLSRQAGLQTLDDTLDVILDGRRRQRVYVDLGHGETVRLWSIVARPAVVSSLETPTLDVWHRNRLSEFVGFSIDRRGRMIGETWVPSWSITSDEWGFYVRSLAKACDRFEYLLTGRDEA